MLIVEQFYRVCWYMLENIKEPWFVLVYLILLFCCPSISILIWDLTWCYLVISICNVVILLTVSCLGLIWQHLVTHPTESRPTIPTADSISTMLFYTCIGTTTNALLSTYIHLLASNLAPTASLQKNHIYKIWSSSTTMQKTSKTRKKSM